MIGLTSLWTNGLPMAAPKLNRRRALFVLDKIDEILAWEREKERERDVRWVDLGRYLCEVRAGQYWRLENLKSFDEFLEKRFPESRRKAYNLMAIHENLTRIPKPRLREVGWSKAAEMAKVARREPRYALRQMPLQGTYSCLMLQTGFRALFIAMETCCF